MTNNEHNEPLLNSMERRVELLRMLDYERDPIAWANVASNLIGDAEALRDTNHDRLQAVQ